VVAEGGRFALLSEGLAGAGLVVLVTGLTIRWSGSIPGAVLLVGGGYLAGRAGHSTVDGSAALIGALLLLAAELASWSIDHDARIRSEPALVLRRAGTLAVLVAAALLVNVVLLATAAVSAAPGALLAAVGVAAAVAAVAVVLRLARVE